MLLGSWTYGQSKLDFISLADSADISYYTGTLYLVILNKFWLLIKID